MSFTPRSRLIIDSTRSPHGATTATMRPSANCSAEVPGVNPARHPAEAATARTQPPMRPSQVLFGLTEGTRRCRPKRPPMA